MSHRKTNNTLVNNLKNQSRACVFIDSSDPTLPNQVINDARPFIKLPFPPTIDPRDLITVLPDGRVPTRAPNAFIIYRRAFIEAARAEGYNLPMTVISSMTSQSWEQEPQFVKAEYRRLGKEAYNRRNEMCPDSNQRRKREKWNMVSFGNKKNSRKIKKTVRKSSIPKGQPYCNPIRTDHQQNQQPFTKQEQQRPLSPAPSSPTDSVASEMLNSPSSPVPSSPADSFTPEISNGNEGSSLVCDGYFDEFSYDHYPTPEDTTLTSTSASDAGSSSPVMNETEYHPCEFQFTPPECFPDDYHDSPIQSPTDELEHQLEPAPLYLYTTNHDEIYEYNTTGNAPEDLNESSQIPSPAIAVYVSQTGAFDDYPQFVMEDVTKFSDSLELADNNKFINDISTGISDADTSHAINGIRDRKIISCQSRTLPNLPNELLLLIISCLTQTNRIPLFQGFGENALELLKEVRSLDASASKLDDEFIRKLVVGPPGKSLRVLDLSRNSITDKSAAYIGYNCTRLQKLYLEGCIYISEVRPLGFLSAHITTLILSHCKDISDESFGELAERLGSNLLKLDLDGCYKLTHESIVKISQHLKNLRYLVIDGQGIGDLSVVEIFKNCKSLDLFSMSFCETLTNASLIAIITNLTPYLKFLRLRKGSKFTEEGFYNFFRGLSCRNHSFHSLDVSECQNITGFSLSQMVQSNIRWLGLDWCWEIKEDFLSGILASCPKLQEISMVGCYEITCETLQEMEFPELRVLNLFSCRAVALSTIKKICQMNKGTYIIDYYGEAYKDEKRVGYNVDVYVEGEEVEWMVGGREKRWGMLNVGDSKRFFR
ncbi:4674_t:CDS:2, partial [Acaulospora morrowiae]